MPTLVKNNSEMTEMFTKFYEKLKNVSILSLNEAKLQWQTELNQQARITFTLLPIATYKEIVFKGLEMLGNEMVIDGGFKGHLKGSKSSWRKSSMRSGSSELIGHRIRSISLVDSNSFNNCTNSNVNANYNINTNTNPNTKINDSNQVNIHTFNIM